MPFPNNPHLEAPLPPLVMAGLDPAIQTQRHTAGARMDWMAASRAAMTSWAKRPPQHEGTEREIIR
jgi:hypothetical protein